jgi:hypothetical protein
MLGGGQQSTPNIAFTKTYFKLTVSKADNNLNWNDFIFTFTTTAASLNGVALVSGNPPASAIIRAGDYIEITGQGDITLRYENSNALIGSWRFPD